MTPEQIEDADLAVFEAEALASALAAITLEPDWATCPLKAEAVCRLSTALRGPLARARRVFDASSGAAAEAAQAAAPRGGGEG